MSELKKSNIKTVTKRTDKENTEIRISVEEIENGFLIVKNKEWRDSKGYQYETKRWFSSENPLEINTENKTLADLFK